MRETLQSIIEQTFKDWELVIINDGSSDSTESIIFEYKNKGVPIIYRYQQNKGLGASRNEALKLSSGEYIAFVDHDDIWMKQKLEKQIPLFENNSKVGLVYSDTIFFKNGKDLYNLFRKRVHPKGYVFREMLANYFLPIETVVIRKETLLSLDSWFDETLTMAEEMDLFLRIAYVWALDYINEPLAKWRIHGESFSQKHPYLVPKETEIILEKLSKLYPNFEIKYSQEIEEQRKLIAFNWALCEWKVGNKAKVRAYLFPYILKGRKLFIAYIFSFFPYPLFRFLQKIYSFLK